MNRLMLQIFSGHATLENETIKLTAYSSHDLIFLSKENFTALYVFHFFSDNKCLPALKLDPPSVRPGSHQYNYSCEAPNLI